jgi:hypothetical protein
MERQARQAAMSRVILGAGLVLLLLLLVGLGACFMAYISYHAPRPF